MPGRLLPLGAWGSAGLALGLTWAFLRWERRGPDSLGLTLDRAWALDFLKGLALGALLVALPALGLCAGRFLRWEMAPDFQGSRMLLATWVFLGVAIAEEAIFRGYPLQRLAEATGRWPALLLTSLAFALAHGHNPGTAGTGRLLPLANIGLAGLVLGLCWQRTRRLGMPMGLHLAWNWVQGCLLGFPVSGLPLGEAPWHPRLETAPAWLSGGAFGLEGSLFCTLVCLAAIPLLARSSRRG